MKENVTNETSKVETPATKAVKKTAATKTATAKTGAAKTAEKKPAARKSTAKKSDLKESVYLQYLGKEINTEELTKRVKEIWTKELKNKAGDMKSIAIYLKPEENAAYYVINDEVSGTINI